MEKKIVCGGREQGNLGREREESWQWYFISVRILKFSISFIEKQQLFLLLDAFDLYN